MDESLSGAALGLAYDLDVSVYDAVFVALARRVPGLLITADRTLHRRAGGAHPVMLLSQIGA